MVVNTSCMLTLWKPLLMILTSSPAMPPFALQSTNAPDLVVACLDTLQIILWLFASLCLCVPNAAVSGAGVGALFDFAAAILDGALVPCLDNRFLTDPLNFVSFFALD